MCSAEISIRSCSKRPSRVGPAERLGENVVEVVDELQHARAQVFERSEARALEQATRQDGEPDFDLVQPGAVARCVDEANPVGRVLEKRAARLLRLEDAGLELGAELVLDAAPTGHKFDERGGTVCVELIGDEDPPRVGIGLYGPVDVGDEVSFRSGSGPIDGLTILPVTTSRNLLRSTPGSRGGTYSNSTRSTRPGRTGLVSWSLSSACMPVFSSVLITCVPSAASCGASQYVSQRCSRRRLGTAPGFRACHCEVSQYWLLCGRRSASLKNGRPVAGRCSRRSPLLMASRRELRRGPVRYGKPAIRQAVRMSSAMIPSDLLGRELRRLAPAALIVGEDPDDELLEDPWLMPPSARRRPTQVLPGPTDGASGARTVGRCPARRPGSRLPIPPLTATRCGTAPPTAAVPSSPVPRAQALASRLQ